MTVFDFKTIAESPQYKPPENCDYDQLEKKYWKLLLYNAPIYGADVSGSLTDENVDVSNFYIYVYMYFVLTYN